MGDPSFSRLLTLEAERILLHLGADTRVFDPFGLPFPDAATIQHPKVQELCALSAWSEGQVWTSPEEHGSMSSLLKAQVEWVPLCAAAARPMKGRTLALMEISEGPQPFNAVHQLSMLGRAMGMIIVPGQSSLADAPRGFDAAGRMRPSPSYDQMVDLMEELVKFTLLTRGLSNFLTDRYSERKRPPKLRRS